MAVLITDADEISRCIIYDRAFDRDIHVDRYLWRFENKDDQGVYHESAVLRQLAPYPDDVHRIGCGIAATQNNRKNEPPPGPKRRYYCGFRTASCASLPREGDGYIIVLSNVEENGEEAHVDVALTFTSENLRPNARATRRTDAGLALAEQFGAPEKHRCECDREDECHPFVLYGEDCLSAGLSERWRGLGLPDKDGHSVSGDNQPKML